MRRCSRVLSFVLAFTLLILLVPSCFTDTVFAADTPPKYVVTSNIGFATDADDTKKPYLASGKKWIANETIIDYTSSQGLQIDNYPSIKETAQLDYIEVDGRKIYYSEFAQYTSATAIDTSSCPNLNGRTVKIRLNSGKPMIQFVQKTGETITQDININLVFQTQTSEAKYTLDATAGEHGTIYESKHLHDTDDETSVYGLWVRPDDGYQWLSYTMDGEDVPVELKNSNYKGWTLSEPNESGDTEDVCNYFEIEIKKNSDITLNFAPATAELNLIAYMPVNASFPYYTLFGITPDLDYTLNYLGYKTSPLVENSGAKFCYTLNINGFIARQRNSGEQWPFTFKIYNGTETNDDALLFDIDDPNAVKETRGVVDPQGQFTDKLVYTGYFSNWGYAVIMNCPEDLKEITTKVTAYGQDITLKTDVQMSSDVPAVKDFAQYYTDTYGLDKLGAETYTEEEKATDGYKLYCQYSNFRYELRKVYREQALVIAASDDPEAALVQAKAALDAAAKGDGCNAVSWSFNNNEEAGTHWKPTLTAIPNDGDNISKTGTSASDAMCAALEAEYPGNWTYTCTSSQFGMFVNSVTAGGENDTGRMVIRSGTNGVGASYGFWYYNGKFSEWGVSNYYPYDGDVMSWGNPDVTQSWNQAILRFHYKNNGGDDALEKDMAAKGVSFESSTEDLQKAFPNINFSRYGQFRKVSDAERVIQQINAIGVVSPDSGDAIDAALKAYGALSEEEKEKVYNYQALLDAKAAFEKLTESSGIEYGNALAAVLANLNKTNNVGIGSTNGAWLTLALARGGEPPRAEDVRAVLLSPGEAAVMAREVWHDACRGLGKPAGYYYLAKAGERPADWLPVSGGPVALEY